MQNTDSIKINLHATKELIFKIVIKIHFMEAACPPRVTYSVEIATSDSDILCRNIYVGIGVTESGVKVIRTRVQTEYTK